MTDFKDIVLDQAADKTIKYININRRSFLKGTLAVGGVLALAGCGEPTIETQTVTVTETNTVTDTKTVTVTETVTIPEKPAEVANMVVKPSMIIPIYERCSGCKICVFECALYHYGSPIIGNANINVYCHDLHRGTVDIPILCMHCNDTPCLAACPEKVMAISIDEITGACKIDTEKCTLCGKCIEACDKDRTGCLHLDVAGENIVGACDFCDGNPSCVQACPEDCLRLSPKQGNGRWWASKSAALAPNIYDSVFGAWYKELEK